MQQEKRRSQTVAMNGGKRRKKRESAKRKEKRGGARAAGRYLIHVGGALEIIPRIVAHIGGAEEAVVEAGDKRGARDRHQRQCEGSEARHADRRATSERVSTRLFYTAQTGRRRSARVSTPSSNGLFWPVAHK